MRDSNENLEVTCQFLLGLCLAFMEEKVKVDKVLEM